MALSSNTTNGGERTARPTALTPKGRLTVQLIRLEQAIDGLTEAEQAGLADALTPLVRVARSRAESRQSPRVGVPLVAARMA